MSKKRCEHMTGQGRIGLVPCVNPAKGETKDGKAACGVHLHAEARREENQRLQAERIREKKRVEEEAAVRQERLHKLGVAVKLAYDPWRDNGGYTGGVELSANETDRLIARLEQMRATGKWVPGASHV